MFALPEDRPALMGILNVTPDSFSEQGLNFASEDAIDAGLRMFEAGADLIDIGGESTRPGAESVTVAEELRRVIPVAERLAERGVPLSIDTRKALVAQRALEIGATVINDVTALGDPDMADVCAASKCFVCLMHMQGTPATMQADPRYVDVVSDVRDYLLGRCESAIAAGIDRARLWIDPGIGFGKTLEHNVRLLSHLDQLVGTGYPVLLGVSRKSSIGALAGGAPVDARLPGTLAAQVLAQAAGVRILRSHDVKEARQAIDVAAAILRRA